MSNLRLDLPPDVDRRLRSQARLQEIRAKNERRFADHPWPYLSEAVFTNNPFVEPGQQGTQKYPGLLMKDPTPSCNCQRGGCSNYLHHIVNIWYKYPRTVWPKSRRLITSWTMIACHEWLARYHPAQVIAFVSRKQGQNEEEGSAELIKRARFIGQHLPVEVQPREVLATWCRLRYPHNGSVIVGIAQGANQIRQLTVTAWFGDEFAFWEHAGATYDASLPALEDLGSRGRCTLVSTPNPGFMKSLVFDEWQAAA